MNEDSWLEAAYESRTDIPEFFTDDTDYLDDDYDDEPDYEYCELDYQGGVCMSRLSPIGLCPRNHVDDYVLGDPDLAHELDNERRLDCE